MQALFEPWSLGDALIAFDTFRKCPENTIFVCDRRWKTILSELDSSVSRRIFCVELGHTRKQKLSRVTLDMPDEVRNSISTILSIRGDPRDYLSARGLFPKATVRMTGFLQFLASKSWLLDLPFRLGALRPLNRYEAWGRLMGVASTGTSTVVRCGSGAPSICIHIGAQWRSKRYPFAARFRAGLSRILPDAVITIAAGADDPLPVGIPESEVRRIQDGAAIDLLRQQDLVVVNDSSAMHLCHALAIRHVVVGRATNLKIWAPPGSTIVASDVSPSGVRSDPDYLSDKELEGWPEPEQLLDAVAEKLGVNR